MSGLLLSGLLHRSGSYAGLTDCGVSTTFYPRLFSDSTVPVLYTYLMQVTRVGWPLYGHTSASTHARAHTCSNAFRNRRSTDISYKKFFLHFTSKEFLWQLNYLEICRNYTKKINISSLIINHIFSRHYTWDVYR